MQYNEINRRVGDERIMARRGIEMKGEWMIVRSFRGTYIYRDFA